MAEPHFPVLKDIYLVFYGLCFVFLKDSKNEFKCMQVTAVVTVKCLTISDSMTVFIVNFIFLLRFDNIYIIYWSFNDIIYIQWYEKSCIGCTISLFLTLV